MAGWKISGRLIPVSPRRLRRAPIHRRRPRRPIPASCMRRRSIRRPPLPCCAAALSRTPSSAKQDVLAIDLSSERARLARWLLDGVRAGQPLGALLGYRFERGLHENHPGFFLDRFIAPLRDLAPLTATRIEASGQPVESVPAKHVVDGLKLLRRWK